MTDSGPGDLQIEPLRADYASGRRSPEQVLSAVASAAREAQDRHVWIELLDAGALERQLAVATARRSRGEPLPLFGVPFAVKDNIDVAGIGTTAACPDFRYVPDESAPVVARLVQAGAIVVGKTNLDQFATGLVGTRSPYGICASAFDPTMISGGSSSGSGLAVALGLVSFALGTDTAGSGRVPASLNNVVGLKPTKGWLSARGVVPACRSLDCVSVFAGNVADAALVTNLAAGYDPLDPFARTAPSQLREVNTSFRFGVPRPEQLFFDGDTGSEQLYRDAMARLEQLGGTSVEIDFEPFVATAALLYTGPWVAERTAAVGAFLEREPQGVDETVRGIVLGGRRWTAVDAFEAQYRLRALEQRAAGIMSSIDLLALPTVPTSYRIEDVLSDPITLNTRLGTYTNFVNLLDLCGVAIPSGFKANGHPFGITLLASAFQDAIAWGVGARYHASWPARVGATATPVAPPSQASASTTEAGITLAVVGAHLRGQPLHPRLLELGARFLRQCRTSPHYRLFALGNTQPPKPGLVRTRDGGTALEIELYALDPAAFGTFTQEVSAPLCIGNVELDSGEWVKGFLCESIAIADAPDISAHGGWRAYLADPKR